MGAQYPRCVEFLQWALPRLGLRWSGFRRVRGQVCKRLRRRVLELGLEDLAAYRAYLVAHPEEWALLEGLTHITISRFNRDRGVFARVADEVLPVLAREAVMRGADAIQAWSAGCASGEEAYTLAIIWHLEIARPIPGLALRILATDADDVMLDRARRGCYDAGSLREVPDGWREAAFAKRDRSFWVGRPFRETVRVARHDLRDNPPDGPFDLVMCRNLAFTYFDAAGQRAAAARLAGVLRPGGALVLGKHEALVPSGTEGFEPWSSSDRIYRRVSRL